MFKDFPQLTTYRMYNACINKTIFQQKQNNFTCLSTLGEYMDCILPAKKTFGTRNYEFMDSKKDQFENYLQVNG